MIQLIKTATISSKRQITIPKSFDKFKVGDRALIYARGEEIIIRQMPTEMSQTAILSEKSLALQWNSKEDEDAFAYLQNIGVQHRIFAK